MMYLFESIEKNSVILMWPLTIMGQSNRLDDPDYNYHITWKFFGETDEDLSRLIDMVEAMDIPELPETLYVKPVVLTPRPDKKVPVLYVHAMPKKLFDLKLKLDEVWPDKFPIYIPHITVDSKIFFGLSDGSISEKDLDIKTSNLCLYKGGDKIKEFPPMRSVVPSSVDEFGIPSA
jgi:2'-5' RNA ligase